MIYGAILSFQFEHLFHIQVCYSVYGWPFIVMAWMWSISCTWIAFNNETVGRTRLFVGCLDFCKLRCIYSKTSKKSKKKRIQRIWIIRYFSQSFILTSSYSKRVPENDLPAHKQTGFMVMTIVKNECKLSDWIIKHRTSHGRNSFNWFHYLTD